MIIPLNLTLPDNISKADCCRLCKHPGPWLPYACADKSGIWALRPGLLAPSDNWIATKLHAVQGQILNNILAQRVLSPNRTLRGCVSRDAADLFRVRCSAASELPHQDHGTWRQCLMWRITVTNSGALPDTNTDLN
ncbi:MAG: hypothetical protein ACKPKO_01135, partial [Candidatus Fonsibacter sp.]